MSIRTEQVASLVTRHVQEVLVRGLKDPRIKGMVTITRATCADDLRVVTLYISVLPEEHESLTLHGLEAAARHIRHAIADEIALASAPNLQFRLDKQFKREVSLLDALAKVRAEQERFGTAPDVPDAHTEVTESAGQTTTPGESADAYTTEGHD